MRAGKDDALENVNSIMQRFMASLDYSKVQENESVHQVWKNVVPQGFEEKTKPLNKTNDGTLFVACENSFVSSELVMQKSEILQKIPSEFEISNIVFTHKAWKKE